MNIKKLQDLLEDNRIGLENEVLSLCTALKITREELFFDLLTGEEKYKWVENLVIPEADQDLVSNITNCDGKIIGYDSYTDYDDLEERFKEARAINLILNWGEIQKLKPRFADDKPKLAFDKGSVER
jgi:hypothetical protein